jgi:beta-barrel assembly-enhancing protease
MTNRSVRTLASLLLAVLLATPAFPQTAPDSADPKAAAKAAADAKKKAEADKKAAEKKAKEDEKLAKEAAKNSPKKKNADLENIGNRDINKGGIGLMKMSLESEIAEGRAAAKELEQSVTLLQDPVITEYVNRVGQNIVRNSDAKVPFTIKVIESDEINAVSLPGGFFYVNTGLILAADEEAELAGVMAHEIAHVTARHAAEQAQKGSWINLASIPLMIFGGGIPGMIIQQAAQIGVPITFLAFTRGAEEEADWLGLQYMYRAGYDPGASVSFFEKLQARESAKRKVSSLFSTHPQTEDRVAETKKNIENFLPPREQYLVTTSEFSRVKGLLARLESDRTPSEKDRAPSLRRPAPRRTPRDEDPKDSKNSDKDGASKPGETTSDADAPPVLKRPQDKPQ